MNIEVTITEETIAATITEETFDVVILGDVVTGDSYSKPEIDAFLNNKLDVPGIEDWDAFLLIITS